jgi:hypothetical protein
MPIITPLNLTVNSGQQYIIDTVPPGESLNEAFVKVNDNFDQIFTAGPVLSNIQIVNNTILTLNTNGNLTLSPNGVGSVIANAHVIPDSTNTRDLGSVDLRWQGLYVQYSDIQNASIGNVTVIQVIATPVAFANLTAVAGAKAFINDGNLMASGNFGAQVSGGAGNTVPVWSDGTNWYIG